MIKKLVKAIKAQLLKINWLKREVDRYKLEQWRKKIELEKQETQRYFAELMRSSDVARENEKDGRMLAVGIDTRGMGQRPFNPVFTREDSLAWGAREKWNT